MDIKRALIVVPLAVLVASCSTTGYSTRQTMVVPRTVAPPTNVHPEVLPYVPEFVDALQQAGFTVGPTTDPDALSLQVEFNPNPFNIRVSASLIQHGVPILSTSATNSGWGTALARGSAVNSRADAAVKDFRTELSKLMAHVSIRADAKPSVAPAARAESPTPPQPPAAPPTRAAGAFHGSCESGLSVRSKADDGSIVILDDGSVWQVSSVDAVDARLWLPAEQIVACDDKLINTDDHSTVEAQRIK